MDPAIASIIVAFIGAAATITVAIITRSKAAEPKLDVTTSPARRGNKAWTTIMAWIGVIVLYMLAVLLSFSLLIYVGSRQRLPDDWYVPIIIGPAFLAAAIWGHRRILRTTYRR
jgi:hypothetical protein